MQNPGLFEFNTTQLMKSNVIKTVSRNDKGTIKPDTGIQWEI